MSHMKVAKEQNQNIHKVYNTITDEFLKILKVYYKKHLEQGSPDRVDNDNLYKLQRDITQLFKNHNIDIDDTYSIVYEGQEIKFVPHDLRTKIMFEGLLKGIV